MHRSKRDGTIYASAAQVLAFAQNAKHSTFRPLAAGARLSHIAAMQDHQSKSDDSGTETLPRWAYVSGGLLLLITALAAPFYGNAMAGLMWAGESIKALCGW